MGLGGGPGIGGLPCLNEAFDVSQRGAVVPFGIGEFVGEGGEGETGFEVGETGVGDGDGEGFD